MGHMAAGKDLCVLCCYVFLSHLKTPLYGQLGVYDETGEKKLPKLLPPVSHVHPETTFVCGYSPRHWAPLTLRLPKQLSPMGNAPPDVVFLTKHPQRPIGGRSHRRLKKGSHWLIQISRPESDLELPLGKEFFAHFLNQLIFLSFIFSGQTCMNIAI